MVQGADSIVTRVCFVAARAALLSVRASDHFWCVENCLL